MEYTFIGYKLYYKTDIALFYNYNYLSLLHLPKK